MNKVDKKMLGIGICLMLIGLTMFFGSGLLPDDTMDLRMIQVMCALLGLLMVSMIGLMLIILSTCKDENLGLGVR